MLVLWSTGRSQRLARELVPNARVVFVPKATHAVQHDAPETVNDALIAFFRGAQPPALTLIKMSAAPTLVTPGTILAPAATGPCAHSVRRKKAIASSHARSVASGS